MSDDDYYVITATITDRWGKVETAFAGYQPVWAWEIDKCAEWRKMMRKTLLQERTSDPQGWRVVFSAAASED